MTDWRASALCAQTDPEIFFPEKGESPTDALKICAKCPVARECRDWITTHEGTYRYGIWGGTSAKQRRREHSRQLKDTA